MRGGARPAPGIARRILPWLVLAAGLGLATLPVWRVLALGASPSLEDLLRIRCPA